MNADSKKNLIEWLDWILACNHPEVWEVLQNNKNCHIILHGNGQRLRIELQGLRTITGAQSRAFYRTMVTGNSEYDYEDGYFSVIVDMPPEFRYIFDNT